MKYETTISKSGEYVLAWYCEGVQVSVFDSDTELQMFKDYLFDELYKDKKELTRDELYNRWGLSL
jgi:hypothetical protein